MYCRRLRSLPLLASTAVLLLASVATADTSLWVPDTSPQPLSAGLLGIGGDGRTTWQIQQGAVTGTKANNNPFPGTATLVEGPNDAFVTEAFTTPNVDGQIVTFAVGQSCAISSSIAVCVGTASEAGIVSKISDMQTVSPFLVHGGGTVSSTTALTMPSSMPGCSHASAGSTPTAGSQATGASKQNNAGRRYDATYMVTRLAAALGSFIIYAV